MLQYRWHAKCHNRYNPSKFPTLFLASFSASCTFQNSYTEAFAQLHAFSSTLPAFAFIIHIKTDQSSTWYICRINNAVWIQILSVFVPSSDVYDEYLELPFLDLFGEFELWCFLYFNLTPGLDKCLSTSIHNSGTISATGSMNPLRIS